MFHLANGAAMFATASAAGRSMIVTAFEPDVPRQHHVDQLA